MRSPRKDTHSSTSHDLLLDLCHSFIHCNFLAIPSDETVRPDGNGERPPLTKPVVKLDLTPVSVRSAHHKHEKRGGMYHAGPLKSETLRVCDLNSSNGLRRDAPSTTTMPSPLPPATLTTTGSSVAGSSSTATWGRPPDPPVPTLRVQSRTVTTSSCSSSVAVARLSSPQLCCYRSVQSLLQRIPKDRTRRIHPRRRCP